MVIPRSTGKTNLTARKLPLAGGHGSGAFVGSPCRLADQDGWWGEGDDMFFIDGEVRPLHRRDWFGGLFPRRHGILAAIPFSIGCTALRLSVKNAREGKSSVYRFQPGFAHYFYKVAAVPHRTWPRQSPLGQFLFRGLRYQSEPTPRFPSFPPSTSGFRVLSKSEARQCSRVYP